MRSKSIGRNYMTSVIDEISTPSSETLSPLSVTSTKPSNKTLSEVSWARLQSHPLGEILSWILPEETPNYSNGSQISLFDRTLNPSCEIIC